MIEIKRNNGSPVKVFAETFEYEAYEQVKALANYSPYADSTIRIMPDAHAGKGCTIGTTMTLHGKGNPDWNYSAPHGAGRLMSRAKAKETLSLDEFKRTMSGIYSTTVGKGTIDESPMAYKPMEEILRCIEPTAKVSEIIKPVYNFKAGE